MAVKTGKRKMSRKIKRTIRKSLSGVCLASALIVALVPAKPTQGYVEPGYIDQKINYSYGVEETDSTDLSYYDSGLANVDLNKYKKEAGYGLGGESDEAQVRKTYMVRQLSDGTYEYNWQFKIYQQDVNGSPYSIVCKYNDTYASGSVSILPSMPLAFSMVEKDFFEAYVQAHINAKNASSSTATINRLNNTTTSVKSKFTINKINEANEAMNTTDDYWIKKYYPTYYTDYKSRYEDWLYDKSLFDAFVIEMDTYYSRMLDYERDPDNVQRPSLPPLPDYRNKTYSTYTNVGHTGYTQSVQDPTNECPSLSVWVADLPVSSTGMLRFFCEAHPDYKDKLNGDDYVLESVKDARGGTSAGLTNVYVYMPKGTPNKTDGVKNDEYGFSITEFTTVLGIGAHAFENTTNVTELNLAQEVKYIGEYAFYKSFVNKVAFSNVQDIGNRAFKECTKLTNIGISDTTVNIGTEAFAGCNMLEDVALSQSISYIGPGAFANCDKLRTLDLSAINQACNISDYAFFNAIALSSVKMSDSIARLGDACFACESGVSGGLTDFKFPDHIAGNVTEKKVDGTIEARVPIGNFVLAGRTNLQHVTMPADYGKNSEVELPYGVFFNCQNLLDVTFPDSGGSCGYVNYGVLKDSTGNAIHTMYDTVRTKEFCVYGPKSNMSGDVAYPRRSTWGLKSGLGNDIPYIYIDTDGTQQVELSNGQYILIIDD
ncbi:MAG: leucine-rich repeat protein, partial [Lachnospiraceae bacterium]|nr:leucine-rich repeat protein [Lachnospiraceae bacterium]